MDSIELDDEIKGRFARHINQTLRVLEGLQHKNSLRGHESDVLTEVGIEAMISDAHFVAKCFGLRPNGED